MEGTEGTEDTEVTLGGRLMGAGMGSLACAAFADRVGLYFENPP